MFDTYVNYYFHQFKYHQTITAKNAWLLIPDDIEVWELEEFLEDILNAEFNLVRDADNDGSDMSVVSVDVFCIYLVYLCQFKLYFSPFGTFQWQYCYCVVLL